jgi:starvation-inducible DNA-binding protein
MPTNTSGQVHEADIGIEADNRAAVVDILNRVLADQQVLYTKTRKYHWNITGHLFYSLHKLLEEQYTTLAVASDEVAERARSLGGMAIGTLKEFIECATLKEQPGQYPDAETMIANLVDDHEAVIRNLRKFVEATEEKFNDMGTSDFLTAMMEAHEKMAWMLRAFLEEKE